MENPHFNHNDDDYNNNKSFMYFNSCKSSNYVTQQGADVLLPEDGMKMSKHVRLYIIEGKTIYMYLYMYV